MTFVKGQSGNPSGRPKKLAELAERFRDACLDGGLADQLIEIARSGPLDKYDAQTWKFAMQSVMEYGFGRPTQIVATTDETDERMPLEIIVRRDSE